MPLPVAVCALAAALLLAPAPLLAQRALPDSGARVRIDLLGPGRVVGTLVVREPDRWLVVRDRGDTVVVTPSLVDRLDVSRGRRSPARAFWRGAGIGALVGVGTTVVVTGVTAANGGLDCNECFFPPVLVIGVGGTALTLATTLVGGVAGSFARERWKRVSLRADARLGAVATPHGSGVALRLALPR